MWGTGRGTWSLREVRWVRHLKGEASGGLCDTLKHCVGDVRYTVCARGGGDGHATWCRACPEPGSQPPALWAQAVWHVCARACRRYVGAPNMLQRTASRSHVPSGRGHSICSQGTPCSCSPSVRMSKLIHFSGTSSCSAPLSWPLPPPPPPLGSASCRIPACACKIARELYRAPVQRPTCCFAYASVGSGLVRVGPMPCCPKAGLSAQGYLQPPATSQAANRFMSKTDANCRRNVSSPKLVTSSPLVCCSKAAACCTVRTEAGLSPVCCCHQL